MAGNYSVLQRNTLDGLSETAGCLYLKLCDVFEAHRGKANERRAFLAAARYDDQCGFTLNHILREAPIKIDDGCRADLARFFADRWRHNFMETA